MVGFLVVQFCHICGPKVHIGGPKVHIHGPKVHNAGPKVHIGVPKVHNAGPKGCSLLFVTAEKFLMKASCSLGLPSS